MLGAKDPRGSLPQILINWEGLYEGTLIEYFQAFFFLGENLNHPYHNFRHCTAVVFLCYEGARFHKDGLSPRQIRNLLIAAIFHDFNHSGLRGDDAENIQRAKDALQKFVLPEDREYLPEIELLLGGTQFPYVIQDDDLGLEGRILRDADMMQAFSTAWIQQVVLGLAAEWNMSPLAVLEMQSNFLRKVSFKTDWACGLVPKEVVALKISEAEALLDILQRPANSPDILQMQEMAL